MQLSEALGPDDFARGDLAAPIVVLHYGDFECPYSAALHPVAEQVRAKFKGRMCLVFRHFPLDDVHPRALAAALAAEAAAQQGAFWPMHDRLFENQGAFEDDDLAAYAREMGLDSAQFQQDFAGENARAKVRASLESGRSSGVHGTPTLWINGVFHDNREGLWKPDRLARAIEDALR